ncbi:5-methylcytosine-specific restriction endonuclease system specificity protein McrC [Rubritalea sp.]|uniref:5-methylcytosine-specific restriction endonuclease system specificity protein McrC n=1 Tax=Rubritalea sp. TaxID=2109375 RepID=UPI003EF6F240
MPEVQLSEEEQISMVGKIPVRNLWLLMLYASDLYRHLGHSKVEVEDNPENIADLVAEILCSLVEQRLMRNLSFGYRQREETINRVRGRIDILRTQRHRLLDKGKVHCRFEELTIDTPRNRYVRAALEKISLMVKSRTIAQRCNTISLRLDRLGVKKGKPVNYNSKNERMGRNDLSDQKMVAAADLVFNLTIPQELAGQHHLQTPDRNIVFLRKLFEKAIAGFYSVNLEKSEWSVTSGKWFKWQISEQSPSINDILPGMKTDTIIDCKRSKQRLVIDTKFNAVTASGYYREQSLRNGYIYQMYAYLRSQEIEDAPQSLVTQGMLLHPTVGEELDEFATIQQHKIRFCTLNLGLTALGIRQRLLDLHANSFT